MNPNWLLGVSDFSTSEPLLNAETIIGCGFDFIEPGLGKAAAMSEVDFLAAAQKVNDAEIRIQSMNWFLPPTVKVTGQEVDDAKSRSFLELALGRAEHLNAKAIVFGSPGSRSIPDGFSFETARDQMIAFCHLCDDVIRENQFGMKIAIEHVNHTETNFINTFAQALEIARAVNRPNIGLAADFYHFEMENESSDIMRDASDLICAVQLANPNGRNFPTPGVDIPRLDRFFENLSAINYQGGISIEASVGASLREDCLAAAEVLSEFRKKSAQDI